MNNPLEQLHDIYSIYHIPFWQTKWFYWNCVGVGISCAGLAFWLFARWYFKKITPPVPYWQHALNQISSLQNKHYRTKAESKQCYFVLTSVMKTYLHKRYNFPLTTQTDDEAACYIQEQALDDQFKKSLNDIFTGCLLIKFANEQAIEEQIFKHLEMAHTLITQTVPEPKV